MVNKERLEQLSEPVLEIYNELEANMLSRIARKLSGDRDMLQGNIREWEYRKLNQISSLNDEATGLVAEMAGRSETEIEGMLQKAGFEGVQDNEDYLLQALEDGQDLTRPPALGEDSAILDILETYQDQAKDTLNLVNSSMLDESEQVYRNVVNRTVAEVQAGTKTADQALRDTVRSWSHQGIPALTDRAGKQWSPEGYVRMVTRTTSNRVTKEIQEKRFDEWGCDLVEVSSHAGARELCAPYQGKIYSRSGSSNRFPSLQTTSQGEAAGLFGINCHHVKYPYFPGYSKKRNEPVNKRENDRAYKNSQKQRKMERDIRKAKTEKNMMRELGDEEGEKMANRRIRDNQEGLRGFIDETGRSRRRSREQIY